MKKLFTLFTMLSLCIASTWAEDYSQGYYTMSPAGENASYFGFYSSANEGNDSKSVYGGTKTQKSAVIFTFEKTDQSDVYYWYDCNNRKYVYANSSGYLKTSATKVADDSYKWYIKDDGNGNLTITDMTGYNSGNPEKGLIQLNSVGGWWASKCSLSYNTGCNTWKLNLLFKKDTPYYIGLQRSSDCWLQYGSGKMQQAQVSEKTNNNIFYFTDAGGGAINIYSLQDNTPMGYASGATEGADKISTANAVKNFYVRMTNNASYPFAFLTEAGGNTLYLSNHGDAGNLNMGLYSGIDDEGTRLKAEEVSLETLLTTARQLVAPGRSHAGHPGFPALDVFDALQEAITVAEAVETPTIRDLIALNAKINQFTSSTILLTNGKLYRFETACTSKPGYVVSANASNGLIWCALDVTDGKQIWKTTWLQDGTFGTIRNVGTNLYPQGKDQSTNQLELGESATNTQIVALGTNTGQFNIKPQNKGAMHMKGWNEGTSTGNIIPWNTTGVGSASAWYIYEVEQYTVSITGDDGNGRIIVNGTEYENGQSFYNTKGSELTAVAKNIANHTTGDVVIDGNTISVTYYDQLYFSTEVTGSTQNVNLGTFSYSVNGSSTSVKLKTTDATTPALYRISKNSAVTLSLSRTYRGFKFNGFYLGEERLGLNPTLSASQLRTVTSDNPVIAKFTAQGDDVTLFYDDDPKSYRIPAIGTTSTGRLIAISDYRHNLDDIGRDKHGTGTLRIDLVYRTSDDNGQTWSEKKILKEGTGVRENADCGFGDAAIACGDGQIAVFSASGSVLYSSTSASSHNCMARFVSTDNGETWEYSDITDKIIGTNGILPGTYGIFFGSGKLAVDKNFNGTGNTRIYGALLTKDSSRNNHNFVVYSDDLGETWNILGQGTNDVANADEPKVEILPNGQILLSSRRSGGRKFNIFTYGSGDTDKANGIGTWGTAADGCPNGGSNATNGEIFLTKAKTAAGTDTYLLLQSQPKGGTGQYDRRDVTVWYKEISSGETYTVDQIKTGWTQGKQISTQLSSYSTMSLQADGKLAFFFEEAPCYDDNYEKGYCMVYMPLTIESVTKGTYFNADYNPSAQVTVNYTLSDEQGNTYTGTLSNCAIKDIDTTLTTQFPIITLGSDIEIVQAEDGVYSYKNTVSLPFKVSNADGEYWHNIYFPSNTKSYYPVYWSGSSGADKVQTCTEAIDYGASSFNTKANADKISWAIYSNGNTFSFTFRNKLADKYISVEDQTTTSSNTSNCDYSETGTAFTITPQGATTYNGDYKVGKGTTGYLVAWSAGNGYTTYSTNISHPGGWVKIVEAPDFDKEIATANEHLDKFRDMPGYYTLSDAASAAKTAMANADNIKLNTLRSYQTLSSSSIVLPESGKFYKLKGSVSNKYAYSKGANTQMGMSSIESKYHKAGLFYFNGNNTDGFSILNYKDGYYVYDTHSIGELSDSTKFQFAAPETTHLGTLTIYQMENINNHGRWMVDNGNNAKVDRQSSWAANNCDWYIEEASDIPVTFKEAGLGYATFNCPVAVQIPENTKAYVCKIGTDGNTLTFYEITSVVDESGEKTIPANTPVLLYNSTVKDAGSDVTVSFPVTTIDTKITNNSFVGTLATKAFDANNLYQDTYSLRTHTTTEGVTKVGFYKKTSGETLAGFKAWLPTPHQPQARNFTIYFNGEDDATGIAEALGLDSDKVEIYDLSGRKLSGYQKGINIVNGKKIFK